MSITAEAVKVLEQRFGKDTMMVLVTVAENVPYARIVDAYYENGALYVITHALSSKMKQIDKNPAVAISSDWFTARGTARSMGWFCSEENSAMAERLREVFAAWIDNGDNDFSDHNTIILRIELTHGVVFHENNEYRFGDGK